MNTDLDVPKTLADLMEVAPAGFAVGLHMGFTAPTFMFQTYPKSWTEEYSREGMLTRDPTVAWGFSNEGAIDWEQLQDLDEVGVLARARAQGLRHGVTVSVLREGSRSIGSFARGDRPFSPEEVGELEEALVRLHDGTASATRLPESVRESLRRLSVAFTHP
jgi:LuxR family transcriptional regulator